MTAQVSFLDGTLSLIHIPLDLYPSLLQPILQVLLPPSQDPSQSAATTALTVKDHHIHGFLNISVTPIECSIVCNSAWAASVFEPAIKRLPADQAAMVAISKDTYAALSVYGTGMDAGSRVADLTSPLALADIPIFFITTYYSDFILVPTKDQQAVVKTLLARNFVFSDDDQSRLVSAHPSPTATNHRHGFDFGFNHHTRAGPSDDPPSPTHSTVSDLQQRTFDLLKKRNVTPHIEPNLTLVQCSGIRGATTPSTTHTSNNTRRGSSSSSSQRTSWINTIDTKLYTSLVTALASHPRFLSLTLAHDDPPSLLLDRSLLFLFGDSLVGPLDERDSSSVLVPIFLDLADLPFEATGIVSGVAGRLVREMRKGGVAEGGELSYLSTARAGAVILGREQAGVALGVLRPLLAREEGEGEVEGGDVGV
ncbi:ACT domain-containing protein [Parachaetomium inaequale]|uniref:ACT domain-containing protein n=1 Tax=Parachaetomium inaequale TaxID=2588326 RepID=A0AAN6PKJ4_9PEZI|nr:ACT domain-containing protein [Parachaetomium inaequale]